MLCCGVRNAGPRQNGPGAKKRPLTRTHGSAQGMKNVDPLSR